MRSDWSMGSWFLFTQPCLISSNITGSKYRSKFSKVQSNLDRNLLIRSQRTLWAEFYFLGISFGLWFRQDLLAFSKLEIQESRLHISCTQMHTHTAHLLTLSGCTFLKISSSFGTQLGWQFRLFLTFIVEGRVTKQTMLHSSSDLLHSHL